MNIVNLTMHKATLQQNKDGIFDLTEEQWKVLKFRLEFIGKPSMSEVEARAYALAKLVSQWGYKKAMIGGMPSFMEHFPYALRSYGIDRVYAHTDRISVDVPQPDGSVVKRSNFVYGGNYG